MIKFILILIEIVLHMATVLFDHDHVMLKPDIFNCRYSRGLALKSSSISQIWYVSVRRFNPWKYNTPYQISDNHRWFAIHRRNWRLQLASSWSGLLRLTAKFLSFHTPALLLIREHEAVWSVINPAVLAATLLFPCFALPWSSNTYSLIFFVLPWSQEQADRRSTWAPAFCVFQLTLLANAISL